MHSSAFLRRAKAVGSASRPTHAAAGRRARRGRGNGRGCHPLTGLLSGGTAPISMDTLAPGYEWSWLKYNTCPPPPPPPPPVGQVCGTQSSVQWRYGAVAQSCNTVCSPGGLSCDLNALATHSRTAECTMALAAQFSVSCNENHLSSGWSGRPSFNGGNNNCYYATTGASLDCTTTWSDISRFCPCS